MRSLQSSILCKAYEVVQSFDFVVAIEEEEGWIFLGSYYVDVDLDVDFLCKTVKLFLNDQLVGHLKLVIQQYKLLFKIFSIYII